MDRDVPEQPPGEMADDRNAGLFQDVVITSFVDFEKLEEVLVVLTDSGADAGGEP